MKELRWDLMTLKRYIKDMKMIEIYRIIVEQKMIHIFISKTLNLYKKLQF